MTYCTKILDSFRNVFINWPPLVIFVVTIALLSGITLALGMYVYSAEDIVDIDAPTWNKFLLGLGEARFCGVAAADGGPAAAAAGNRSRSASVLLRAGRGHQLIAEHTLLARERSPPDGLNVTLEVVHRPAAAAPLVCVRITQWTEPGDAGAAPLPPPKLGTPPDCDAAAAARGTLDMEPDTSWRRCQPGGRRRLRLRYRADDEWDVTISAADQQRIYTHLSVTSVFLLATAVCMVLVTALRNRTRYTLTAGDKVSIADG